MDTPGEKKEYNDPGYNLEEPEFYKERGNQYFKQKNYKEAARYYIKALKLDSNYAPAWNNLALAFKKIGKEQEAQECLDKYNKLVKQNKLWQSDNNPSSNSQSVPLAIKQNPNPEISKKPGFFSTFSQVISTLRKEKQVSISEPYATSLPDRSQNGIRYENLIDKKTINESHSSINSQSSVPDASPNFPIPSRFENSTEAIISNNEGSINQPTIPSRFDISADVESFDGLTDNTILPSKGELIFAGHGQAIQVGRYKISDPLTYWSEGPPRQNEASCIDILLPIGEEVEEDKKALPYYPQYSRISPDQSLIIYPGLRQVEKLIFQI